MDGAFQDFSCGMPGFAHDRRVLRRSKFLEKVGVKEIMQGPIVNINGDFQLCPYVLGDAGYTLEPFLMVPYNINPNSTLA
ncbi:hypothetical protein R1flu_006257 [Riccia fluitans]|uniref:DDE Tnp4 domain-containing protein n=1 Tax=Riccia fluitans TaxID=41844 RepID=A0ABD1YW85_9MARC